MRQRSKPLTLKSSAGLPAPAHVAYQPASATIIPVPEMRSVHPRVAGERGLFWLAEGSGRRAVGLSGLDTSLNLNKRGA